MRRTRKKQKLPQPNNRSSIYPIEDRWNFLTPNSEEQHRVLKLYRKLEAVSKSYFDKARIFCVSSTVIIENEAAESFLQELSNIVE